MTQPPASEILDRLRAADIHLRLEGDSLRVSAPPGTLTEALRAELAERKPELVALLQSTMADETQPLPRVSRDEPLPLSTTQQRLWFFEQLVPNSALYNVQSAWLLVGHIDTEALDGAYRALVARHESLRTSFSVVDGVAVQRIAETATAAVEVADLRVWDLATRDGKVRSLVEADARRPFAFDTPPLMRLSLYRLADTEHILLLTLHHIVTDGWSMQILLRELGGLYTSMLDRAPLPPAAAAWHYADYAAWQARMLIGDRRERLLLYWTTRLQGAPPILDLPTDRPRPAIPSYRGSRHRFAVPRSLTAALAALGRQEGATLYMVLLAAFDVLLSRYSGQMDLCLGTPVAGRDRAESYDAVGFFVNTLVLRADLSGEPSFRSFLSRVRQQTLADFDHQQLPLEIVVEQLHPERIQGHNPLFQVMFVLQDAASLQTLSLPDVLVTPLEVEMGVARFDLALELIETPDGLAGELEYASDLFDATTIARLAAQYATLLAAVVDDPDRAIGLLPLLPPAERQQVLYEWNATTAPYAADRCLHELFEEQVARTPEACAVEFETTQLTYAALDRQANRLARRLQRDGVGPETLVALCVERSPEMVVGILAILKAGGAYVPLDPTYPPERLEFMLADSQAALVLTTSRHRARFAERGIRILCLDAEPDRTIYEDADRIESGVQPENLAYVIYTSGSTGQPKGVLVQHSGLSNVAASQARVLAPGPSDRVLQFASLSFDASVYEIMLALLSGATLVMASTQALAPGRPLLKLLRERAITIAALPPAAVAVLPNGSVPALRTLLVAGEACPPDLIRRWAPGRQFINGYGPTEASICTTLWPATTQDPVLIGRPIANVQVLVLDRFLQPVPIGVPGELYIGGAGLARGYLNRADLTAERFVPHPFSTIPGARLYRSGDRGRYRADGNLEYLGRVDRQVKIRGFRIEPGEIEAALCTCPQVAEAAVVVHDHAGDRRLTAYVTPRAGSERPEPSRLRISLERSLPRHMVPASFVVLDNLPRSPNGKLDRRALPAPEPIGGVDNAHFVAPELTIDHQLVAIWEELLDVRPIGMTDDFFELGGHSLLAATMVERVEQVCGKRIPLAALFTGATIARLKTRLFEEPGSAATGPVIAIQRGGSKRPFFFLHGDYSGGGFYCADLARRIGPDQPFYALQPHGMTEAVIPPTIEAMARSFIEPLRAVQPKGPYLLGGYCAAAMVALELAQQLRRMGEVVKLVVMVDPTSRPRPRVRAARALLARGGSLLGFSPERQIALYLKLRRGHFALSKKLQTRRDQFAPRFQGAWRAAVRSVPGRFAGVHRFLPGDTRIARKKTEVGATIAGQYAWVFAHYHPRAYRGHVELFWSEDIEPGSRAVPSHWWPGVLHDFAAHAVPGDHITSITRYSAQLADQLRRCLDACQDE